MKHTTTAYKEGKDGFLNNLSIFDYPYPSNSKSNNVWREGWMDSQEIYYNAGFDAYIKGIGSFGFPSGYNDNQRNAWLQGWCSAKDDNDN